MPINSVNSNASALQALQSLDAASVQVQRSQDRVSTGLKVASAKDDGSTWSIAQTMKTKLAGWQVADDSLTRGQTVASIGEQGATQILDLLHQIEAKLLAFQDPTSDATSRAAYKTDIENLVSQIDSTAKNAEFNGIRPLADTLTPVTVTTTTAGYTVPSSSLAPPSLTAAVAQATGTASQTFDVNGGSTAGRIDLYLQAYSMPDVLEVYQNGTRVAATGQPYAPGGGPVGPGAPVSGENILSFDYNPASGQDLQFQFNANRNATGSVWTLNGVALQNQASPIPSTTTTTTTVVGTTSAATTYTFVSDPSGSKQGMSAQPLTANALGLDSIDWNDPAAQASIVTQAIATAQDAADYFGREQNLFSGLVSQNQAIEQQLQTGVGNLVDADLGQESAKLQAGQAKQELATKALSIANAAPQWILSLFR
jgi:flagellin